MGAFTIIATFASL